MNGVIFVETLHYFPFILLNLMLSMVAAMQAPAITAPATEGRVGVIVADGAVARIGSWSRAKGCSPVTIS